MTLNDILFSEEFLFEGETTAAGADHYVDAMRAKFDQRKKSKNPIANARAKKNFEKELENKAEKVNDKNRTTFVAATTAVQRDNKRRKESGQAPLTAQQKAIATNARARYERRHGQKPIAASAILYDGLELV